MGVKKNANVIVKNTTTSQWYVVVLPQSLATSTKFGKPNTVGYAKNLGAAIVNPGSTLVYPVPAGAGQIGIIDPAIVPKDLNALIPVPGTGQGTTAAYTVDKGKSVTKTIAAGPVIK